MNPHAGNILSELQELLCSFQLKSLEYWLYFRFWEKGQGHDLSDKVVCRGPAPSKIHVKKRENKKII